MSSMNEDCDEIREALCTSEAVSCFCVSTDAVVWCGNSGSLYYWDRQHADPVYVGKVSFVPRIMAISNRQYVCLVGDSVIGMYLISSEATVDSMEDDRHDVEEVGIVMSCVFERRASVDDGVHVSLSGDASIVAVSSRSALRMYLCRGPFPDQREMSLHEDTDNETDLEAVMVVDCSQWYQEPGCARTCFASPERLFVLSTQRHLVAVTLDWKAHAVVMERDGHVLTRVHKVLCMAVSSVRDGLLAVGLTDGTVKLLQMDTLQVVSEIDTVPLLERLLSPPIPPADPSATPWTTEKGQRAAARRGQRQQMTSALRPTDKPDQPGRVSLAVVLDVAIGNTYITVATPDAVLYFGTHSLAWEENKSIIINDVLDCAGSEARDMRTSSGRVVKMQCASSGSWACWNPDTAVLQHYLAALCFPIQVPSAEGEHDLVHAQQPLKRAWLLPLRMPHELSESVSNRSQGKGRDRIARPLACAGSLSSKPVTFGHPIKGSGYSELPWSMQQAKKATARKLHNPEATTSPTYKVLTPYDAHPLVEMASTNRLLAGRGSFFQAAVLATAFSACGDMLLAASGDGTGFALRFPAAKFKGSGIPLRGHKAPVLSIHSNLSPKAPLVVSGAANGTINLWKPMVREAPYISHELPRKGEVRTVRFFYQDRFVSYTHGANFGLCQYAIDNGGGVLNKARNESCLSPLLFEYAMDTQHITCMDSINHFTSNVVVLAGSNKQLCILDVAAGSPVRLIPDAHCRTIHHVAMCSGSRFAGAGCTLTAQHHFVTASLDGVVRLWDLRQPRPARQFSLHRNQGLTTVALALSPTGSMIAVGSEDRSLYVYDVSVPGCPLATLTCSDVPSSVSWHPVEPIMAVGLSSGEILFYGQR